MNEFDYENEGKAYINYLGEKERGKRRLKNVSIFIGIICILYGLFGFIGVIQ